MNCFKQIPKSAYINANDFSNPKELANYLVYLSSNTTAYNLYFKWKKHVNFGTFENHFAPLCDMCIKLHLESFFGIKKKIVTDVEKYWNKGSCDYSKVII